MMTIAQARRELAGLSPHNVPVALYKLVCLRAFWKADQAAGGRNRCATRQRIAEQLTTANPDRPITEAMLERWEMLFLRHGVIRLAVVKGRHQKAQQTPVIKDLSELSTADLLKHATRALSVLSSRLASQK